MKILWLSDTPHRNSGFGVVSAELGRRLADKGYQMGFLGWWANDVRKCFAGVPVEPCPLAPAEAAAVLSAVLEKMRPDYLITLADVPWIGWLAMREIIEARRRSGTRWCCYFPVDGTTEDGRLPRDWRRILAHADLRVAMSNYGAAACLRSDLTVTCIPHGCDTGLFCPPEDKSAAKRRVGYDGKFIVLADARNHRRKLLSRLLDIIAKAEIPQDSFMLHLHTNLQPKEDLDVYSYDLRRDVALTGLAANTRLDGGYGKLPVSELVSFYQAADVHLETSYGEGFGLPTLQAASTGLVSIAGAHSANSELLGRHGFAIPASHSIRDEFGITRPFIDRNAAAMALRRLFEDPALFRARSSSARNFALGYDWELVASEWMKMLEADSLRGGETGSIAGKPIVVPSASGVRPTGHSTTLLPFPLIAVPTRLAAVKASGMVPIVIAQPMAAAALAPLSKLFPNLRVDGSMRSLPVPRRALAKRLRGAVLVVDPDGILHPRSDAICAAAGVSFLGSTKIWPEVPACGLLAQARMLLTDHGLAAERLSRAREQLAQYWFSLNRQLQAKPMKLIAKKARA